MMRVSLSTDPRRLIGQRQQRITLGTAKAAARMFSQKKYDEGENQTQADRECERDDGHGEGCALLVERLLSLVAIFKRTDRPERPAADIRIQREVKLCSRYRLHVFTNQRLPSNDPLPCGQPVIEIVSGHTSTCDVELIRLFLNILFRWF
jgi:hypothetical protein